MLSLGYMDEDDEGREKEDLELRIGKVTFIPVYEPKIPRNITDGILRKEELPSVGQLGSSILEDFIIKKIKQGDATNEQIVESFFSEGIPEKIKDFIREVQMASDNMNWEQVFNDRDLSEAQAAVLLEMRALGLGEERIKTVAKMKLKIEEGIGISSLGEDLVYASCLQAVRNALDYVKVFGQGTRVEELTKVFLTSAIGHELGHKVNDVAGIATSRIPNDWRNGEEWAENKIERFAEYWGQVPLTDDSLKNLREREWLIQLHKTKEVWGALHEYNSTHNNKIDLFAIFRGVKDKLGGDDTEEILSLINAREMIYGNSPVENYASPYSRDVVAKAVIELESESN